MRPDLHGLSYKVGEVAGADALHHPSPVILDGLGADVEPDADFFASKPGNREIHHFALPC